DMGRKIRIFTIQGRLLGENYLTERDNLLFVCEQGGVGELIHPFFGSIQVHCETIKFSDETTITRKVDFTIVFLETGNLTFPIEKPDTQGAIERQVDINLRDLKSPFERIYDEILSKPLTFSSGALESLNQGYDILEKAKQVENIGPTFARDLKSFRIQATGIVTSGAAVFESILSLITFGLLDDENRNDDINQVSSFRGLSTLLDYGSNVEVISNSSKEIDKLIQAAAVITMSLNTSRIEFKSATAARETRNILLLKIDQIVLDGVSDQVTQNYENLRAVIVQDIDTRSISLPQLKIINPIKTIPALVLTHNLYGDISRVQDIIERNKIEHPGFIPGSEPLEVLLDA
ncbi:DNA circularization N-terminal domain-containing protein, partial [candidate division KSB1 bacterium]|nr:DNA circularization N-terminal domain-containing protein [candidate division KSB1 bacterium]